MNFKFLILITENHFFKLLNKTGQNLILQCNFHALSSLISANKNLTQFLTDIFQLVSLQNLHNHLKL